MDCCRAYSQLRCPKGWSNGKKIAKNYFGFLLCLLFCDYMGMVYDYNYNDVMLIYYQNVRTNWIEYKCPFEFLKIIESLF